MTISPPSNAVREIPVGPSLDAWRAMSPEAREAFVIAMNAALTDAAQLMSEGQPHKRAKSRAMDLLGLHFKAKGRTVYLAEELSVLYPGERGFAPDVLAVLDVPQAEEDERLAWVVADEGRGLDAVLEVLHDALLWCDDPATLQRALLAAVSSPEPRVVFAALHAKRGE